MKSIELLNELMATDTAPAIHRAPIISQHDKEIVAACLVGEAGGEGLKGMTAVMNVIVNRAHGRAASFRRVAVKPGQFTMFNGKQVAQVVKQEKSHPLWQQALMLVDKAANGGLVDITHGATKYYAPQGMPKGSAPDWADYMKHVATIGHHLFFKESQS